MNRLAALLQEPVLMPSPADLLQERAEAFAVRVLQFVRRLPRNPATDGIARQLARSGPSVSANYRSARRSRSRAEFIARLGVVVDEADESEHWLSMLKKSGLMTGSELDWLLRESAELRAIFGKSLATARANQILKS
jgi:four helix bundle protein